MDKQCKRCFKRSKSFCNVPNDLKIKDIEKVSKWGRKICCDCKKKLIELYPLKTDELSEENQIKVKAFDNINETLKNGLDKSSRIRKPIWKMLMGDVDPKKFQKVAGIKDRTLKRICELDPTFIEEIKIPHLYTSRVISEKYDIT
jgi:hypothetical protein